MQELVFAVLLEIVFVVDNERLKTIDLLPGTVFIGRHPLIEGTEIRLVGFLRRCFKANIFQIDGLLKQGPQLFFVGVVFAEEYLMWRFKIHILHIVEMVNERTMIQKQAFLDSSHHSRRVRQLHYYLLHLLNR